MQQRKVVFAIDEIYHIYNRSIAREQIFTSLSHLGHIFDTINYYRYTQTLRLSQYNQLNNEAKQQYLSKIEQQVPIVEIYSYAFMPNHFHLLLKQTQDEGIKQFLSIIENSYAKYFNTRHNRQGSMFQSPFQGKWIENDEQFLHVSRYIHLNPVTAFIIPIERLRTFPYTSFSNYVGLCNTSWLNVKPISDMFSSQEEYSQFVENQSNYQQTLAKIKDLTME